MSCRGVKVETRFINHRNNMARGLLLCLAVAAGFCCCCLSTAQASHEPRGVHPDKKASYSPRRDFTCLDGSATFPFELVNDDYCDCADGSDEPGTSACPNGRFHCPNKGHKPQDVLSSRVNDGICDCCDGSDEYDSDAQCTDSCEAVGRKAKEEEERQRELQAEGYKTRLTYAQQGAQKRAESQAKLDELEKELKQLKSEVETLKTAKEAAEEPEIAAKEEHRKRWEEVLQERKEARKKAEAMAAFDELDTDSDSRVSTDELQAKPELDDDGDGEVSKEEALEYLDNEESVEFEAFFKRVWDVVSDKCKFQPPPPAEGEEPVAKKKEPQMETVDADEEGEDEDYDDDYYDEVEDAPIESDDMPDYDNATKELIDIASKARDVLKDAENRKRDVDREVGDLKKFLDITLGHDNEFGPLHDQCYELTDREYTYRMCPFNKVTQKPKKGGRETSLGTWGSWAGPGGSPYSVMKFENGEKCWNGPSRSTLVTVKCGLAEEVMSASEPNRCEYAMEFSTPAVCELTSTPTSQDPHQEL